MDEDIKRALDVLNAGGVILYPTDTIWGIGCDATNEEAVKKVYNIKQRVESKSLIILVPSINRINSYVDNIPDIALDIMELATKPTTVILDCAKNLPNSLINEDGTIAIRVPEDDFCQKLLSRFRRPIVSTSANVSGELSPINFSEIADSVVYKVDFVVNYNQNSTKIAKSSSIIQVKSDGQIKVIRE